MCVLPTPTSNKNICYVFFLKIKLMDIGVPTHWGGSGNGWTGGDWGVYCPPPQLGFAIHCNSYYQRLVSGGGAESGNSPIQAMVGAARPV